MLITTSADDDAGLFLRWVALSYADALVHSLSPAVLLPAARCSLVTLSSCRLSALCSFLWLSLRWAELTVKIRTVVAHLRFQATLTAAAAFELERRVACALCRDNSPFRDSRALSSSPRCRRCCRYVFLGCVFEIVSIFLQLAKTLSRNSSTCVHAKRSSLVAAAQANLKINWKFTLLFTNSAPASTSTSTATSTATTSLTSSALAGATCARATRVKVTENRETEKF